MIRLYKTNCYISLYRDSQVLMILLVQYITICSMWKVVLLFGVSLFYQPCQHVFNNLYFFQHNMFIFYLFTFWSQTGRSRYSWWAQRPWLQAWAWGEGEVQQRQTRSRPRLDMNFIVYAPYHFVFILLNLINKSKLFMSASGSKTKLQNPFWWYNHKRFKETTS